MTVLKLYNKNGYENPVKEPFYKFSDLVNEFFNQEEYPSGFNRTLPMANIIDKKESFLISIALPGINKSEIKMDINKNILTISHSTEHENRDITYLRNEFDFSNFSRSFSIPESVNPQGIKAKYNEGILNIELPKKNEAIDRGPKEIKIS